MRPGSVDYAAGARKHLSKIVFLVGSVSLSGKGNSSAQPLPAHVQRSTAVGTHTSISCPVQFNHTDEKQYLNALCADR